MASPGLPIVVEIDLALLSCHAGTDHSADDLREMTVRELERQRAQYLTDVAGRPSRFLGVWGVKHTSWKRIAKKRSPAGPAHIRPRVASSCEDMRAEVITRNRKFAREYRAAWSWLHAANRPEGEAVVFPHGTWQMRKRGRVAVAPGPAAPS